MGIEREHRQRAISVFGGAVSEMATASFESTSNPKRKRAALKAKTRGLIIQNPKVAGSRSTDELMQTMAEALDA